MGTIIKFAEHFFFSMVWVFLLIIAGFFILAWLQNNGGGFFGGIANWVDRHAQPQA